MKIKLIKDEAKVITFGLTGCLITLVVIGLGIGLMAGVAVAVFRLIAE